MKSNLRKYLGCLLVAALPAHAQTDLLLSARDAWQKRDKPALQRLAEQARAEAHPLAMWMDYWQLAARLPESNAEEVEAFYRRWPGSYGEDRLRNDWLLVVGERGDWATFAADYPRFRMDDDRDLHCQALRAEAQRGKALKPVEGALQERALAAWLAQRDADSACHAMAQELLDAKVFGSTELTRKLQRSSEDGRARAFRQSAGLHKGSKLLIEAHEQPERFLARRGKAKGGSLPQLEAAIAVVRLAAANPAAAAQQLRGLDLSPPLQHWAWLQTARQALLRLQPDAIEHLREALALRETRKASNEWSDETHAAVLRIALRAGDWALLAERVAALPERLRGDAGWRYWGAQAAYRSAPEGERGDAARQQARAELARLSQGTGALHFYGQLAADELGRPPPLPPAPLPITEEERRAAADHPGLARALLLFAAGLRNEATREWNFSLRDFAGDERRLLAAAQLACERQIWDRCISTSERTATQIDLAQRYPTPFREQVLAQARAAGLDPAEPYGLMRQESRFVTDARSQVGAAGLMQVMPATARWTAKKLGIPYGREQINDTELNMRLGMAYLRMVLDDFDGALPLAAAAYNAGPGRPRRWREGGLLDAAAWAETIPFSETRDYVKKVLANATVYARLLGAPQATLRQRLGQQVGPRVASAKPVNEELP